MPTINSNKHFLEYANQISWSEILEPVPFSSRFIEVLDDGTKVFEWTYDDGELCLTLQTFGEEAPALICDFDQKGSMMLNKFQAIKKFRCGDNWTFTKQLITESISNNDNLIDKISRKAWGNYLQSSSDMSPEVRYYSDPLFQALVDAELGSIASRELAKIKYSEMEYAQESSPVGPVSLNQFLTADFQDISWVIDGLLVSGGTVFLAAKAKSGKTTLSMSLLKSLADGNEFLDAFPVHVPQGNIGYLNLELTEPQMKNWISRQNIEKTERVHFWNLRGRPNPFRSPISRTFFAEDLKKLEIKTLIIDTFSKIFPGEANNNSEVNKFLIMIEGTLRQAGVQQLIMLVHAGNDGSKIRGATALTDHPDGIWYLATDDDGNRYFHANGRDVSVPEGQLTFEPETGQLSYSSVDRQNLKGATSTSKVLEFIRNNPGSTASMIDEILSGSKEFKIRIRKQLVKQGLVLTKKGPRNSDLYFLC